MFHLSLGYDRDVISLGWSPQSEPSLHESLPSRQSRSVALFRLNHGPSVGQLCQTIGQTFRANLMERTRLFHKRNKKKNQPRFFKICVFVLQMYTLTVALAEPSIYWPSLKGMCWSCDLTLDMGALTVLIIRVMQELDLVVMGISVRVMFGLQ